MYKFSLFLCLGLCLLGCQEAPDSWELLSPNANIKVELRQEEGADAKRLMYSVSLKGDSAYRLVVQPSALGIEREGAVFDRDLRYQEARFLEEQAVQYEMKTGGWKTYQNKFTEAQIDFVNAEGQPISIQLRAYDNGMAFRYHFPSSPGGADTVVLVKENSEFHLGPGNFWGHPYDTITKYTPAYETYYSTALPIGTEAPTAKNGWAFPLLFETQNGWALVSESGLDGTHGGSHVHGQCQGGSYRIKYAEAEEAMGLHSNQQKSVLPMSTPWRFITLGNELKDIVESHLVTDLAAPSKLTNTDWIQPGVASWSWWSDNDSPQDYKRLLPFVDVAQQMGWNYSLVDANWNRMKNGSLEQLAKYAQTKDIGLLAWYNSGGPHNTVEEAPRDLMLDADMRKQEFERLQKMGIRGIKVDFFQSDKQAIIQQYIDLLEDAATYQLLVNFHGCTLPRGWRRTYPHLMTMEAVRGGECYIFAPEYPTRGPAHISALPFTRGVVGPTDYTPGGFSNNNHPHLTTHGFELALPFLIESGITHMVEKPAALQSLPDFAQELLRELPVVWDETRFIAGYPGKEAVLARRKANKWYISGINGEAKSKALDVDLSSLLEGSASISIIRDGQKVDDLILEKKQLDQTPLRLDLPAYGGFVILADAKSS